MTQWKTTDEQRRYSREYYARTRPHQLALKKKYREENADKIAESKRCSGYKKAYGITCDDYERMLVAQGSRCALCWRTPTDNGRRLAVDHDHVTGSVRGLLCIPCNQGVARFGDSVEGAQRLLDYLTRSEA